MALRIPPHVYAVLSAEKITPSSRWAEALALGWVSARRRRSGSRSKPLLQGLSNYGPQKSRASQPCSAAREALFRVSVEPQHPRGKVSGVCAWGEEGTMLS